MPKKPKKQARNAFCKNMRRVRRAKEMTQEELSRLSGFSRQRIAAYENGVNEPNISQAMKIAQVLNVSMDQLCEEKEGETYGSYS